MAFVEQPEFSLSLTLYGGDISILPGLEAYLQNFVRDSILRCAAHAAACHARTSWPSWGGKSSTPQGQACTPTGMIMLHHHWGGGVIAQLLWQ